MPINMSKWKDGDVITKERLNRIIDEAASVLEGNVFVQPQQAPTPATGDDADLVNRKFYFDNMAAGGGSGSGGSVPSGGSSGQVLVKNSGGNYDTKWATLTAGDVGAPSLGAFTGALLGKADTGHSHAEATTTTAGFMPASDREALSLATSLGTADTLVLRDGAGRFRAVDPSNDQDVATKHYVDSHGGGGGVATRFLAPGNISGTYNVDLDSNPDVVMYATLTGNVTITFSNVPSQEGANVVFVLRQDATGGRTLTMPAGSLVINGPVFAQIDGAANAVSIVNVVRAGGTWMYAISDTRPPQRDPFYFSALADGSYYVQIIDPVALDVAGVQQYGTGTLAWQYDATGSSGFVNPPGSNIMEIGSGGVLKLTVTSATPPLSVTIPRAIV